MKTTCPACGATRATPLEPGDYNLHGKIASALLGLTPSDEPLAQAKRRAHEATIRYTTAFRNESRLADATPVL